jgi:hypothetical protein
MMVVDNSVEVVNSDVDMCRLATQASAESELLRLQEERAPIHRFDIPTAARGKDTDLNSGNLSMFGVFAWNAGGRTDDAYCAAS